EDGIRDYKVTGVQTCALPISACSQLDVAIALLANGHLLVHSPFHAPDIFKSFAVKRPFVNEWPNHFQKSAAQLAIAGDGPGFQRSEERRVGKECRSRWTRYDE